MMEKYKTLEELGLIKYIEQLINVGILLEEVEISMIVVDEKKLDNINVFTDFGL